MKTKPKVSHTPLPTGDEPWFCEPARDPRTRRPLPTFYVRTNRGRVVCKIEDGMETENEAMANFIVQVGNAHSDLLAATMVALMELRDPNRGPSGSRSTQDQLQAAINKATPSERS